MNCNLKSNHAKLLNLTFSFLNMNIGFEIDSLDPYTFALKGAVEDSECALIPREEI